MCKPPSFAASVQCSLNGLVLFLPRCSQNGAFGPAELSVLRSFWPCGLSVLRSPWTFDVSLSSQRCRMLPPAPLRTPVPCPAKVLILPGMESVLFHAAPNYQQSEMLQIYSISPELLMTESQSCKNAGISPLIARKKGEIGKMMYSCRNSAINPCSHRKLLHACSIFKMKVAPVSPGAAS